MYLFRKGYIGKGAALCTLVAVLAVPFYLGWRLWHFPANHIDKALSSQQNTGDTQTMRHTIDGQQKTADTQHPIDAQQKAGSTKQNTGSTTTRQPTNDKVEQALSDIQKSLAAQRRSDGIAPIQVSVFCTYETLPINVISGKPQYIVMVYETFNKEVKRALYNRLPISTPWPEPSAESLKRASPDELLVLRCDFTNRGEHEYDNVVNLDIPITFDYEHNVDEDRRFKPVPPNVTHTTNDIFIAILDHGQTDSVYFMNGCYVKTTVHTPTTAIAKLVGETNLRNFQLEGPDESAPSNPTLKPTHVHWFNGPKCVE